jgi:DNA-directed RNA polymerase specialized sigma24 family protein
VDHHRKLHRARQGQEQGYLVPETPEAAPDLSVESLEQIELILQGLSDNYRAVLFLRYVLELSHRDIATVMEISVPAVKMLQMRAIRTAESTITTTSMEAADDE